MKNILLALFLISTLNSFAQQKITYSKTVDLNKDFKEAVTKGMAKYNKKYRTNDFYNFNVNKTPVYESQDTVIYDVKFLTSANGLLLWNSKGVFTKEGDQLKIELSEFKLLKRSSMRGVDYINVNADDLEPTKGNKMNLTSLKEVAESFFDKFK